MLPSQPARMSARTTTTGIAPSRDEMATWVSRISGATESSGPQPGLIEIEPTSELALIAYRDRADLRTVIVDVPMKVRVLILYATDPGIVSDVTQSGSRRPNGPKIAA